MAIKSTRLTTTNAESVFLAVGQQAVITIYICNTSGSTVSVNVFAVSDGSTSGGSENQIYSELEITPNDTYVISTEKMILDDTDQIEVQANVANVVTVTVSSIEI